MWTKLLFWKRFRNRIYAACPEVRHLMDADSKAIVLDVLRLVLASPILIVIVAVWGLSRPLAWLSDTIGGAILDWVSPRRPDLFAQMDKIVPRSEIRRRLGVDDATICQKAGARS